MGIYFRKTLSKSKPSSTTNNVQNYFSSNNTGNENNNKTPWYKRLWVIILLSLFAFPIGICLFWKYIKIDKLHKYMWTIIFGIFFILFIGSFGNNNETGGISEKVTSQENESTYYSSEETANSDTPLESEEATTIPVATDITAAPTTTQVPTTTAAPEPQQNLVWISETGKKYHRNSSCSNMNNPQQVSLDEALSMGLEPCKKCY